MGYPTKVQLIQRNASKQWYINFPSALAQAMEFAKSEVVEWIIKDKDTLVLQRKARKAGQRKKKNGSFTAAFQYIVGRMYGCFLATTNLAACQTFEPQSVGLPGTAHNDWFTLCRRTAVCRLVC